MYLNTVVGRAELPAIMPGLDASVRIYGWSSSMRVANGTAVWDVSLDVDSVFPSTVRVPWSEVVGSVLLDEGPAVLGPAALAEYRGDMPEALSLYFDDSPSKDSFVTGGDRVVVAAATPDLGGAWVHLECEGLGLGSGQLPQDLRSTDLSGVKLHLGQPVAWYAPYGGTDYWQLTMPVTAVEPSEVTVPWYCVQLFLFNATGVRQLWDNQTHDVGVLNGVDWRDYTSEWVVFVHLDSVEGDRNVTVGDSVGASGIPAGCAGGRIEVRVIGRLVTTIDIPETLPGA